MLPMHHCLVRPGRGCALQGLFQLLSHIDKVVVGSTTSLQDLSLTVDRLLGFVIQDEEARMSSFFLNVRPVDNFPTGHNHCVIPVSVPIDSWHLLHSLQGTQNSSPCVPVWPESIMLFYIELRIALVNTKWMCNA